MPGVWDFPEIDELQEFVEDGVQQATGRVEDELVDPARLNVLNRLELSRAIVIDEWGRGDAEVGEDPLDMILFFGVEQEDNPTYGPESPFGQGAAAVRDMFVDMIGSGEIDTPENATDWFDGFNVSIQFMGQFEEQVSNALGNSEGNTVADLTNGEVIELTRIGPREVTDPEGNVVGTEPIPFDQQTETTPFEELREEPEEEEPEPEPEEEEEDIEDFEGPERIGVFEDDEEEEPEEEQEEEEPILTIEDQIDDALDGFSIDDLNMEIPSGKPTRRVERRTLYDFELQMGLPGPALEQLEGFSFNDTISGGVGLAAQAGLLGSTRPPANFPRTAVYVKTYLSELGPQYIFALYKELLVYSAFISGFHNMTLRPGRYNSFVNFMYRLHQIGERGGPELVEKLSQQQAAARGLDSIPDHPTIEGAKAPWLNDRTYYDIVEENIDHPAWDDPVEYLYEEVGVKVDIEQG